MEDRVWYVRIIREGLILVCKEVSSGLIWLEFYEVEDGEEMSLLKRHELDDPVEATSQTEEFNERLLRTELRERYFDGHPEILGDHDQSILEELLSDVRTAYNSLMSVEED